MKFKGTLSCQGLRRLEKGIWSCAICCLFCASCVLSGVSAPEFLPCLEKHGKSCTLLLNPDDAHVIQQSSDTDGMQLTVRWARVPPVAARRTRFSRQACSDPCGWA